MDSNLTAETRARLTTCHVPNSTLAPRRLDWTALVARFAPPVLIGIALAVLMAEWGRYLIR
jgi:hypothetical protein